MRSLIKLCASATLAFAVLASPSMAAEKGEINLKFHSWAGKAPLNMAARWWMDEIEKRTNGRVEFTRIFGGALGKLTAQPENIKVGAFDVGSVAVVYNAGLYSLGNAATLPFMGTDALAHAKAAHELYSSGPVNDEFTKMNQKYLFPGLWTKIQLLSHEPVRTIEDLRKQKIRAHGGAGELLKTLGITVYGIPWGELPAAAERKVVTAAIIGSPQDAYVYGFGKIFSHWNQENWFFFPLTIVMNMDSWNKLPADVQKIVEEVNAEMVVQGNKMMTDLEKDSVEKLGKQAEVVKFEEMDKLLAARDKTWQNWIDARQKDGKEGQAVFDKFMELLEKHKG